MKSTIEDVSMSNADNGVTVSWTECCERPGKGTFENRMYDYKKMVFKEEELDKAFALYKEKFLQARDGYKEKKEKSSAKVTTY